MNADVVVGLVVVVVALGLLLIGAWRGASRQRTPANPSEALQEYSARELIDRLPGPPGH